MSTPKLIDVSKLNQTLVTYDKGLRALPFATLQEVAAILGLNVMDLQGKHALNNERRRAGGTQSYKIGKDFRLTDKLLGYEPSVIEPKDVVCITKENSQKSCQRRRSPDRYRQGHFSARRYPLGDAKRGRNSARSSWILRR